MTTELATATEAVQQSIRLGPVAVRTDAADVAAFAQALGNPETFGPVPLTFPIRWLSLPEVRGRVLRWLGTEEGKIVHLSQSFDFVRPLELDRNYSLETEVHRNRSTADETILRSTVRDAAGHTVVLLDAVLRMLTIRPRRNAVVRPKDTASEPPVKLAIGPVDLAQTRRYAAASLDSNPLHTDIEAARAIGLQDIIAHGMMVMGQFERAIAGWRRDLRITRLNTMFLQPLPVGRPIHGERPIGEVRPQRERRAVDTPAHRRYRSRGCRLHRRSDSERECRWHERFAAFLRIRPP